MRKWFPEFFFTRIKPQWVGGSLLTMSLIGVAGYWIAQLEKEIQEDIREWTIGLLFPAVVGGGGYWLNQQSENRAKAEQDQTEAEAEKERKLREYLAGQERQEWREQSDLKYYFDRISTLSIEHSLAKTQEGSEAYHIARALTANILRELTEERMNQVMSFLRSLKLTGRLPKEKSEEKNNSSVKSLSLFRSIDLSNAELQNLDARLIDFIGADLSGAKLNKALLVKANLSGAILYGAILIEAQLSEAKLNGAILIEAQLNGSNLNGAILHRAMLDKANLNKAQLHKANLSESSLDKAELHEAELFGANLSRAELYKAELYEANLNGAKFHGAKLHQTKLSKHLSQEQQEQCKCGGIYDPIIGLASTLD